MLRKILILSALFSLMMAGCKKGEDNGGNGDGNNTNDVRLQFSYTCNNSEQDLLTAQVHDIRVYLFDQKTGVLSDIIPVGRQDIMRGWVDADIPAGIYTAAAWGAGGTDITEGGYIAAQMTNPAAHTYTPAKIGATTLDNFRMMLACDYSSGATRGEVSPKSDEFDDLFHALVRNIVITKDENQSVGLDFIKNTSTLKVVVMGLEYIAHTAFQPLELFVTGRNERYGYDNTIGEYAREVHYEPYNMALTPTAMNVDIKVQRLYIEKHITEPVLLYVRHYETGVDMIEPLNVVEAILGIRDVYGNYIYETQQDIDRADEFVFGILIQPDPVTPPEPPLPPEPEPTPTDPSTPSKPSTPPNLKITVTLNGFEIVDVVPEVVGGL